MTNIQKAKENYNELISRLSNNQKARIKKLEDLGVSFLWDDIERWKDNTLTLEVNIGKCQIGIDVSARNNSGKFAVRVVEINNTEFSEFIEALIGE